MPRWCSGPFAFLAQMGFLDRAKLTCLFRHHPLQHIRPDDQGTNGRLSPSRASAAWTCHADAHGARPLGCAGCPGGSDAGVCVRRGEGMIDHWAVSDLRGFPNSKVFFICPLFAWTEDVGGIAILMSSRRARSGLTIYTSFAIPPSSRPL